MSSKLARLNPWVEKRDPENPPARFPVASSAAEAKQHWAAFRAIGNMMYGPAVKNKKESE